MVSHEEENQSEEREKEIIDIVSKEYSCGTWHLNQKKKTEERKKERTR